MTDETRDDPAELNGDELLELAKAGRLDVKPLAVELTRADLKTMPAAEIVRRRRAGELDHLIGGAKS